MARPVKLSKQVQQEICRAVRAGNYPAVAARVAGISESTYYRWMEQGRSEPKGPHHAFYEAIKKAQAESEAHAVAILRSEMKGDWRAAVALLERRHSERWRRRERHEHTIEDERPVLDLSQLTDRELKTLEKVSDRLTEPD